MAIQPPVDIRRAERMRKGQLGGRLRTGARQATKEQEKVYLDRFRRLADDPGLLLPRWQGRGGDPFAAMRRRLEKIQRRRGSRFWLKWHGRGKKFPHAYAHTLRILQQGRIPSFASIKFRGRDVPYVLRGSGLRNKLVAIQNHDQDDVRLLGYTDLVRRKGVVIVSVKDTFLAQDPGTPLDAGVLRRVLEAAGLDVRPDKAATEERLACAHLHHGRSGIEYGIAQLGARVALCRACIERVGGNLDARIETYVLVPKRRFDVTRRVVGTDVDVHPEAARDEFERLLDRVSQDAEEKAKNYDDVNDLDRLDWALEALYTRLEERDEGYILAGRDLWLGDFDAAAEAYGTTDTERRALGAAFRLQTPRTRAGDPTVNKLLEDAWDRIGLDVLRGLVDEGVEVASLEPLARLKPSDALAELDRVILTEERFAAFPRFDRLDPRVQLAHDLFKAHRTGNTGLFGRRLREGIQDEATRPLSLAMARAVGENAAVEWQVAPHEKDQAVFWEPYARALARSEPETYAASLTRLASALEAPAPRVRAAASTPTAPPGPGDSADAHAAP